MASTLGGGDRGNNASTRCVRSCVRGQKLGSSLLGVEIGNECDGYGAPGSYFPDGWSLAQFETLWNQFRSAIAAAAPGVAVTGPRPAAMCSLDRAVRSVRDRESISMVTQHYYRGDGYSSTSTAANLISPDANLQKCLGMLNGRVSHWRSVPVWRVQFVFQWRGRGRKQLVCVSPLGNRLSFQ